MGQFNINGTRFLDVLRRGDSRRVYILLILFGGCTLFYYFGELVSSAGWEALRLSIFYSVHDVHRLLFLIPIIYAAYFFRVKGAAIVTVATFFVCLPRALFISPYPDPLLRMVLFVVMAGIFGVVIGIARNNIERRSYLEGLVRSERDKLLGILNRMEEGVLIIGPDYRVRFINPAMVRDFGRGLGLHCFSYLHRLDQPCPRICRLPDVLRGATERLEYSSPDGRNYEVLATPYIDSDGIVCQLATFRNITQRKKVEAELIELNRLKSELVSNVSHELKSPLTSIKGIISSLLQKDIKWDEETRYMLLTGISEETDRLTSLVTNILNMSKLEAGVWQPDKERCFIADIINEIIVQQRWVHKKHTFVTDIPDSLPEIYADYGQVRQVLINLLENAAAFSEEGTEIKVSARPADRLVEVCVADQGVGIPHEDLGKIFNKFYRGHQERKRPGGTGLGLAICQALVKANGGQIWVESEVGRGSTFHFTVPAQVGSAVKTNGRKTKNSRR